jgi:hypothetical protein
MIVDLTQGSQIVSLVNGSSEDYRCIVLPLASSNETVLQSVLAVGHYT